MTDDPKFALDFALETVNHLVAIERKYHSLIMKAIDEQLSYLPEKETRNRKPLERPTVFGATWELRMGANSRFRIFYEVNWPKRTVHILAIGVKEGNRLFIGGKEVQI